MSSDVKEPQTSDTSATMRMIERLATNPDVSADKLARLLSMQERMQEHEALVAFNVAFVDMQAEIPTILERAHTEDTTYAPLEDIMEQVRPILQKHGFSLSFRTDWPDKRTVSVVGILTHRDGHSRESQFLSDADASGSKNAIQALGSAVSYGRRYTTRDLLNITTRGADDDGKRTERTEEPDVTAPAGYEAWVTELERAAEQGMPALTAAWNASTVQCRHHLLATKRHALGDLKATASKVSA